MPGLGAGGALGLAFETVPGTWVTPSIWAPIMSESLAYTEEFYYSEAIQGQTVDSDVKHGPYHIEGDVVLEADTAFLPYFFHAGRYTITKTGVGPYVYTCRPSTAATTTPKSLAVTLIKNGSYWKFAGCKQVGFSFTIENGVLQFTSNIIGAGEETTDVTTPAASWPSSRSLFGLDAHQVYVGASNQKPNTNPEKINTFNGFTFTVNHNGSAQNRINPTRKASYIAFAKDEGEITSQFDLEDRVDYNNFTGLSTRAIRLQSLNTASDYVDMVAYRTNWQTYTAPLSGLADIIMADVSAHFLASGSPAAYEVVLGSVANIT